MIVFGSFVLFSALSQALSEQPHPAKRGEICNTLDGETWRCSLKEECGTARSALVDEDLTTCSQNGTQALLCCPPSRPIRSLKRSKANAYCESQITKCPTTYKWNKNTLVKGKQYGGSSWSQEGVRHPLPGQYPHVALIGYGDEKIWSCSGGLISEWFVLTAAYCCHNPQFGTARWVRLGAVDGRVGVGEDYRVADKVVHPGYRSPQIYNDLALLRLDREVRFSTFVQPACLHTMPKVPYGEVTTTGWTKSKLDGGLGRLLEVESAMIQVGQCNTLRRKDQRTPSGVKPELMLCSGSVGTLGESCQGFAGSPLVMSRPDCCLHFIVGISSIGDLCGDRMSPGLYARISSYLPWIESVVWP